MRVAIPLLSIALLVSCSSKRKSSEGLAPPSAHLITSDGTPVAGAPEPEVVQLRKIETTQSEKHVTVGNVAGEYVLVCSEGANDSNHPVKSCLSPRPQHDYLLFRENSRWQIRGATKPMSLSFMQDFSVIYSRGENIGLLPAHKSDDEEYGVYWLSSWVATNPMH